MIEKKYWITKALKKVTLPLLKKHACSLRDVIKQVFVSCKMLNQTETQDNLHKVNKSKCVSVRVNIWSIASETADTMETKNLVSMSKNPVCLRIAIIGVQLRPQDLFVKINMFDLLPLIGALILVCELINLRNWYRNEDMMKIFYLNDVFLSSVKIYQHVSACPKEGFNFVCGL